MKKIINLVTLLLVILIVLNFASVSYAVSLSELAVDKTPQLTAEEKARQDMQGIIGASLTLLQVLTFFIITIFNIVNIIKCINIKIRINKERKEFITNESKLQELKEKLRKIFKKLKIGIFTAIAVFAISGIMSISKNLIPIVYLYPTQDTQVSVILGKEDMIISSYPKYTDGWNVLAKPDGSLIDLNSGKKLYALFYENYNTHKFKVEKEGFVVKGNEIEKFLEEKLEILGLNYKEKEEFIINWLPQLENNKYNYIRFATDEEINDNMPLDISVKPDTLIRIFMTYKPILIPFDVEEQELISQERNGFVVVEWGGTRIK